MVKSLSKLFYYGVKVFAKSLKKSVQEEIELSKQKANIRYADKALETGKDGMTLEEAQQILNLRKLDPIQAEENFKQLFEANKGLKYLQSKVYRAKEAIDIELAKNYVKINSSSKKTMKENGVYVFFTYALLNDK
ncbi:unnamed protein product [Ceutorhynchus assimilis]|uniref:Uncharacterized protein n=1 Tax=Ceutorhynchus assimilis TaxID=467358 RepID=A0A9N9MT15_9CUCU|nr:unnamed protein product [Ceutorhynchus assimilis]